MAFRCPTPERVRKAKEGVVFKDKATVAADASPKRLWPGGINPFSTLYEMPSEGLHELSDDECCAIVDRMDKALEYSYTKLKAHIDEQKAFIEALKGLSKKET